MTGKGVRGLGWARTNWDVLYPFKVKIASAGGLFHLEREENSGNYCAATYPPRLLSHGKGGTDRKIDSLGQGEKIEERSQFLCRVLTLFGGCIGA